MRESEERKEARGRHTEEAPDPPPGRAEKAAWQRGLRDSLPGSLVAGAVAGSVPGAALTRRSRVPV